MPLPTPTPPNRFTVSLGAPGYTVTPTPDVAVIPPSGFTRTLEAAGIRVDPIEVGGGTAPIPPVFTSPPTIVGTPQEGVAAVYATGVVTGTPTPALSGQWLLSGVAQGATYTPTSGTAGQTLVYQQTASNAGGVVTSTSVGVTITAAAAGADTRPRYWYGPATDYNTGTAAAFAGATPLTSSSNGGKTGSFASAAGAQQYVWLAVLQSAGDIHVTVSGFDIGFNGAGSAADFSGTETSPSTSAITHVDTSGTYLLYRSNTRGLAGVTFILVSP